MSLCFRDSFLAAFSLNHPVKISHDQYLENLLAHFRGVRHGEDALERDPIVSMADPFGALLRAKALSGDYEPLRDTSLYQNLFKSCFESDLEKVKSNWALVEEDPALWVPLQPLATIAASRSYANIFKFCLEKGAIFDHAVNKAARRGAKTVPMLNVLLEANWRNMQTSSEAVEELINITPLPHNGDTTVLEWYLEHGARITAKTVVYAAALDTPISTMSILLQHCNVAQLSRAPVLSAAAGHGNLEIVRFLLDSGMDINVVPDSWDPREPGESALWMAVREKRVPVVQLLLERGADPHTRGYSYELRKFMTAAEQAEREGGTMAELFAEYTASKT